MKNWKFWRLVILLALLGGFAWTLYSRGVVGRFGGDPTPLATDYKTEHEWATREIALDIEEMAAFAAKRSPQTLPEELPADPWESAAFMPMAQGLFGDIAAASNDAIVIEMYPRLTEMDVTALADSSATVSKLLAADMRDARAHESAALVLGAFALRESADLFTDVRWSLNRMTAHLAVARALRGGDERSPDGALANVLLLALSNHQSRALGELRKLGEGAPPEPLNAWIRALRIRITQDWRTLPEPAAASRLEKLEYFRARRQTTARQRADKHMREVNEPLAVEFARMAQDSAIGVEDGGQFTMPALELELEEAGRAYQLVHGRPMPASLAAALNHRASRLISGAPQVLPWGAWAEFYQRHIAMNVGMVDSYVRHMQGAHERANEAKQQLDHQLGELTFFPVGTLRRTKGSEGTEADLTYLREIIDLAAEAPELIAVRAWHFAEMGARYEPVPRMMPALAAWFRPASADVPFEAGIRISKGLRPHSDVDALVNVAPHDATMLIELSKGGDQEPSAAHARGVLEHHHDYDLRAIDATLAATNDVAARKTLQQKGCAISTRDCLSLANTLLYNGEEDEAASIYERALGDPALDVVARAHDSLWLTRYYFAHGQVEKAVALAEEAASSGAGTGYSTRAWLHEQMGNLDDAERDHLRNAEAYDYKQGLVAFYYRRVEVDKNGAYEVKWRRWLAEVFPNGLQPEPQQLSGVPQTGVFINRDSAYSRNAGIRAGDIVVGLEGWRVDTYEQYSTINEFKTDPVVKITLSRGGQLVRVEAKSPTRLFGTGLQTHPMRGWIKD
jgi:tetratricopeptide (TPR) repeat protein